MKGSLVNRNGHYSIILEDKDPVTGDRRRKWIKAGDDYREAVNKMNRLVYEINNGTYVEPTKLTVKEYLENWLRDYCKPYLSPNTTDTYNIMVHKHIIPTLGNHTLTALKPEHLQRLYSDKLASGLSNRTVQYIHTTLSKSLKMAVKSNLVVRNVAEAVESPKPTKHEFKVLNENDINTFLEAAKKTEYYALFYTMLFTGLRRSEALALQWKDVDLILMQISVNRSMHQLLNGDIIYRQPKTAKSRRLVALSPSTCIVLREHLEARIQVLKSINPKFDPDKDFNEEELVFCKPEGKTYLPNSVTHAWIKLIKKCSIQGVRLHDARHTHASLMLKQGIHPKIVQERLGHATITTTLDIYSHVSPGLQKAAAKQFDDIVISKAEVKV